VASPSQKPAKRGQNAGKTAAEPVRTAEQKTAFVVELNRYFDAWGRTGRALNGPNKKIAFVNAMNDAAVDLGIEKNANKYSIDVRTLNSALTGSSFPQWNTFQCIQRVLFPGVADETGSADEVTARQAFIGLWRGERSPKPKAVSGRNTMPPSADRTTPAATAVRLAGFISYSHRDVEHFRALKRHLSTTEFAYGFNFWADDEIHAGEHWNAEIAHHIAEARLFLLLVSDSYFDSRFIREHEIPAIEARLGRPGTKAIPVILTQCGWKGVFGHMQAVPTFEGSELALDRWQPTGDGYHHARDQIEVALGKFFNLVPRTNGSSNPLLAAGQKPAGVAWLKREEQFVRDTEGGLADVHAAADPAVTQLQQEVARQADNFARTAARLGNTPGWGGIDRDARHFAEAMRTPAVEIPGRILAIYGAFLPVATILDMDLRLRGGSTHSNADPLRPEDAREAASLIDIAALWLRQYPGAAALDATLRELRGAVPAYDDADALIQRVREKNGVRIGDESSVRAMLRDSRRDGEAGKRAAQHGSLGILNLFYRGLGLLAAELLGGELAGGSNAPSSLARIFRDLLAEEGPRIERLFAQEPADIRHAIDRLQVTQPRQREAEVARDTLVRSSARYRWSDERGTDQFGPWASFTVTGKGGTKVSQRLRWCPAGSFRMGSPEKEEGRFEGSEDLSDLITFARGFWMFEIPCTQALWMAVMDGDNPSRFQDPDRPVEQVSFRDARRFVRALNRTKRGLGMTLPSEAQWEYACRAGTDDATYAGPALVKGKDNAGILNEIAWWGGNSGSETHEVGQKQPNSWGLHDMLGNVWEWCADAWHENHDAAAPDGRARDGESAARRVIRGGSWFDDARNVRAAYRNWNEPGDRDDDLGFRCARGLGVSTARSERRDAGPGKRRERSDQVAGAGITRRAGGAS